MKKMGKVRGIGICIAFTLMVAIVLASSVFAADEACPYFSDAVTFTSAMEPNWRAMYLFPRQQLRTRPFRQLSL